jgi:hypothetical protein
MGSFSKFDRSDGQEIGAVAEEKHECEYPYEVHEVSQVIITPHSAERFLINSVVKNE